MMKMMDLILLHRILISEEKETERGEKKKKTKIGCGNDNIKYGF